MTDGPAARGALAAAGLLAAEPARAHGGLAGEGFAAGALHPLAAVEHLVLLLATGLLAGTLARRQRRPVLAALAGGLLAGLAVAVVGGPGLLPATVAIPALALVLGLLLALGARPAPDLAAGLALGAGLLVGMDSDVAGLVPALGVLAGVALVALGATGLSAVALSAGGRRRPLAVAGRVAGAWIAAVALMLLALAASGRVA